MTAKLEAFGRLLTILDELREKCPWDKKQTMESLRNLTIEETYELADAILEGDLEGVKEEIGDVMLHLIFYAKIADEKGIFDIADSLNAICDKLIHRHPHIYGDVVVKDENEVKKNWEMLKLQEKGKKEANGQTTKKTVLGGVPKSLPAMIKSFRIQEKVAKVGFEWDNSEQIWDKVTEELAEFRETIDLNQSFERQEDEFGDVLFSLINYARYKGIDPEMALEKSNQKFTRRYNHVEANATRPLNEMDLPELEELWKIAKSNVDNK
jgi:MazG family protein